MFRRSAALAISSVLVLALMGAATAAPPEVEDTMTGFSILTPGQSGLRFTTHEADQLQTYASLADDDNITDAELSDYFHELQFGSTDAETEDEYQPAGRTDVTIYRNSSGVPQVYGDTDEALATRMRLSHGASGTPRPRTVCGRWTSSATSPEAWQPSSSGTVS
jgi:hypothetical protein